MTATPVKGRAKRALIASLPDPGFMDDASLIAELQALVEADKRAARRWACDRPYCDGEPHRGWLHRHARWKQRVPPWDWSTWLMMTGRGWGKTKTAAETVRQWANEQPGAQIAVVARKETLVREICFESPVSGLRAVIPPEEQRRYISSVGNLSLTLENGTTIFGFGAQEPDNLRGWAFDKVWCDEYAAWPRQWAQEVLDMLWFCLREAPHPQVVISTTPKALPHVKVLVKEHRKQVEELGHRGDPDKGVGPGTVITTGHTEENRSNLSAIALSKLDDRYAGTRIGRQELSGELLEDVEGALWQQWMLDTQGFRLTRPQVPQLQRVVVALDPAVTNTETADESGICVAGRSGWFDTTYSDTRPRGYVLASELHRATPMQTMRRVAELYHQHKADAVVIEANNGGDYLPTTLAMVDPTIPVRIVNATRDKRARATPVANLYEQGRVHHVGPPKQYDSLETTMTSYTGAPESQEKSPDDLDALVWAMWDLFLDPTNLQAPPAGDKRSEGRR